MQVQAGRERTVEKGWCSVIKGEQISIWIYSTWWGAGNTLLLLHMLHFGFWEYLLKVRSWSPLYQRLYTIFPQHSGQIPVWVNTTCSPEIPPLKKSHEQFWKSRHRIMYFHRAWDDEFSGGAGELTLSWQVGNKSICLSADTHTSKKAVSYLVQPGIAWVHASSLYRLKCCWVSQPQR